MKQKIILIIFFLMILSLSPFVSAHKYIFDKDFGSIHFDVGTIEDGVYADGVDVLSTFFSKFVDGAFARYRIQNSSYNGDIEVMVVEFQDYISFNDFQEKFVDLLIEYGNYNFDYLPTTVGESLSGAQILRVNDSSVGRFDKQLYLNYVWTSKEKFIYITIQDFHSIEGIPDKESDFKNFLTSYVERFPSTLVKPQSCTEAGYKCTSAVRGCGLDYQQKDLDCGGAGVGVICCEDVSHCGDDICDTEIDYPFPEDSENCPEDCKPSCVESGYKCTPATIGCGHYTKKDYDCDFGSEVICCSNLPFCGDGVCFEHDFERYSETKENCPDDCGETMDSCLDYPNKYWDQEREDCYDYSQNLVKKLCDDPDGGKKPYILAHVFGFRSPSSVSSRDLRIRIGEKDICLDNNTLREYYCSDEEHIASYEFECRFDCSNGKCEGLRAEVEVKEIPIDIPEDDEINKIVYVCSDCEIDQKCYPFNYRKDGKYCSIEKEFIPQLDVESSCISNFECKSNLCTNYKCASGSIWAKFLRWLNEIY